MCSTELFISSTQRFALMCNLLPAFFYLSYTFQVDQKSLANQTETSILYKFFKTQDNIQRQQYGNDLHVDQVTLNDFLHWY